MTLVHTIRRTPQDIALTAEQYIRSIKETGIKSRKEAKMEHLKEPILLNKKTAEALQNMKGTLGFNKKYTWFVIFQDFNIKEEISYKKRWRLFSRKEIKIVSYYLTDYKFHMWNYKRNIWSHMSQESLVLLLEDYDFPNMRKNYFTMIKAPLEFLGVKFRVNKITGDK